LLSNEIFLFFNLDFDGFVEKNNCFDNSIFLCRRINLKLLSANLLSLFLNKTCQHSSLVTGEIGCGEPIDPVKTYDYKQKKLENFEWSILDYFMFLIDLNSDVIIYFKNFIEVSLAHNPSLINLEFKFRSIDTVTCMCQRDDIVLIDAFFSGHSLRGYNDINDTRDKDLENEKILRYVDSCEFFLSINYCECFETALHNQNEKIAIHLVMMLKYVILSLSDPFADLNQDQFSNIMKFNKKFLKSYLPKAFQFEWWELIELVLDYGNNDKFIFLLANEFQAKRNRKKKNKSKMDAAENSILMLICQSKKSNLLR
jgi:hypothetical protein